MSDAPWQPPGGPSQPPPGAPASYPQFHYPPAPPAVGYPAGQPVPASYPVPPTVPGYPGPGAPGAQQPGGGLPRPVAVAPVPGTAFGLALVEVRPTPSGPAVASLVAGIASLGVSSAVLCSALAWGPAVAGAFAVLTALVSIAAVWLGLTGLRRVRRSVAWGPIRGRGMAVAGLVCGLVGLLVTALVMLFGLAASLG